MSRLFTELYIDEDVSALLMKLLRSRGSGLLHLSDDNSSVLGILNLSLSEDVIAEVPAQEVWRIKIDPSA